jgi:uncharacterized LabA/DUF88 family protein
MQRFIDRLRRLPRFEVKLGKLQCINGQFRQKKVDVLMSLDIVDICVDNGISHAIIVAGDADFVPAVKKAKDRGVVAHLWYHPDSVHNELLDEVDELHTLTPSFVESCRLSKPDRTEQASPTA